MGIPIALRPIWRVVQVVMSNLGLTLGLYLFTWGPYFHDLFSSRGAGEETTMLLIMVLFLINLGLVAFLEIPTGAIGDALGRKQTVVWSLALRVVFFVGLGSMHYCPTLAMTYLVGILASVAFALDTTFFSGTFTAWVVDSTRERAPECGYERLLGRGHTYNLASMIVGSIVGILLYLNEMAFVGYIAAAFLCVSTMIFCIGDMEENQLPFVDRRRWGAAAILRRIGEIVGVSYQVSRQSPAIMALIALYAAYMFLLNLVDYLWPVALKSQTLQAFVTVKWVGLAAGLTCVSAVGAWLFTRASDRTQHVHQRPMTNGQLRRWLLSACLMAALPIAGLSVYSLYGGFHFWAFSAAVLAVEFGFGVMAPSYQTMLNNHIPAAHAQERATINSFGSMVRSLLVLLLAIPAGGRSAATTAVSWIVPAILLVVMVALSWLVLRRRGTSQTAGEAPAGAPAATPPEARASWQ